MGTKRFDIRVVDRHLTSLQRTINNYKKNAQELNSAFEQYTTNEKFDGQLADAAKWFMEDKEMNILSDVQEMQDLLFSMYEHMYDAFKSDVDDAYNARIDVDVIKDEEHDFDNFWSTFDKNATKIEKKAASIASKFGHLADFEVPHPDDTNDSFDAILGKDGFLQYCIDIFKTFDANEKAYEKSQNFDEKINDILKKIKKAEGSLAKLRIDDTKQDIYDFFKVLYEDVSEATKKYTDYLTKMKDYLLGKMKMPSICLYDPVNLCNGNYINEQTDLKLGGRYIIEFKRFYNSLSNESGPLGIGWTHNYNVRVKEDAENNRILVRYGDGSDGSFVQVEDIYLGEHGESGILERIPDGEGYILREDDSFYQKFDGNGYLISLGDCDGDKTFISYETDQDGNRRLKSVKTKSGSAFYLEYYAEGDNSGLIKTLTDHSGRAVSYVYENGRLVENTKADGGIRRYSYSENGKISDITDPNGVTFLKNEFDSQGRTIRQSFPDQSEMTYEYDDVNRTVTATELNGNKVIYAHDELERHIGTKYYDGEETFGYNLRNEKISITDKKGNTTHMAYDNKGHLTKIVDAMGNVLSMTYMADGKPLSVKGPDGASFKYSYDGTGKLSESINPLGEKRQFLYENGNISKTIYPNGGVSTFEYDERDNLTRITDPDGMVSGYEYDELNRVIATITGAGTRTTFEYDDADRITKATDVFGNTREYTYDRNGNLISAKAEDGTVQTTVYDAMGRAVKTTDESGRVTEIAYNSMGKQEKIVLPNGGVIRYEYDPLMRLKKVTDPEGRSAGYDYDPNGNVIAEYIGDVKVKSYEVDVLDRVVLVRDAKGRETSFEYDGYDRITAVTDPLGNRFTREYDLLGRVIREKDALGNVTGYTYTKRGDLSDIIDPAGRVRHYDYTVGGKLKAISFCGIKEQEFTYDKAGRITRKSLADGYVVDFSFDVLGRVSEAKASDGHVITFEYDARGRVAKKTDCGDTTIYTYTPTGRISTVVDALGNETAYTYDLLDNIKTVHRAEGLISEEERNGSMLPTVGEDGRVTLYSYNLAGQISTITDALGQKEVYEYDQYGRLKAKTDRDNFRTTYDRDELGNVTNVGYGDGRSVAFTYNALDQLVGIRDWLGNTTIENDALGRVLKVTDYKNRTVAYEYGSVGEKTRLVYPDGREALFDYNDRGQLSSVSFNGESTGYDYDNIGRLTGKSFANGTRQSYSYLPGGFLKEMSGYDKNSLIEQFTYRYNKKGFTAQVDRLRQGLDAVSGRYEYNYDAMGRLISSACDGVIRAEYRYDAFGNRKSFSENDAETSYSYDALDRLVEAKESLSCGTIFKTYDYDRRGNQTGEYVDGQINKSFTYDATGMLSRVSDREKGEQEYRYNGMGFRVASIRPEKEIEYLCDLTRNYYNLLERTVNGETESFVYDNNVLSMNKAGDNYYYLLDELGSPARMTGTDGYAAASYAFDDFGRQTDPYTGKRKAPGYTREGNVIQPFAFTGYQEDEVSGLNFAQARFYDANTGRFQSEDNVRGFQDSPFTMNRYGYCWDNPISFLDLDGFFPTFWLGNFLIPEWLEGVWAHAAIEQDVKQLYGPQGYDVQSNVFIFNGGIGRTRTGNGLADIVMKKDGVYSVYEIKPARSHANSKHWAVLDLIQVSLYVTGINNTILDGRPLSKFGQTEYGEVATYGTEVMEVRTTTQLVGNKLITVTYYSNGCMIYYDVQKIEYNPLKVPSYATQEEEEKSTATSPVRSYNGWARVGRVLQRTGQALFGAVEILGGGLCYTAGGALVLDDGTVVGIADDTVAAAAFTGGSYLIVDGWHKIVDAIVGCGGH